MCPQILIAEEHEVTRRFLADNLAADGYEVITASDRDDALRVLAGDQQVDAVLVDVNGQTLGLIDTIRRFDYHLDAALPIIVLTGHADVLHRVRLLERRADDVMLKPFSYAELRARLANLLSRSINRSLGRAAICVGPLTIDTRRLTANLDGTPVSLSKKEYELLMTFVAEPTRVFTREELMRAVWGFVGQGTRSLDATCSRLRAKLSHGDNRFVENVWGVGYRLVQPMQIAGWERVA